MEALVFLLVMPALVLALVALIFVIVQAQRQQSLLRRVDSQLKLFSSLRAHTEAIDRRLRGLEQRGVSTVEPAVEPEPELHEIPAVEPTAPEPEARDVPATPPVTPQPEVAAPPATAAPKGEAIERQFGTKVVVWIGAIALALSGAFLVKYTFEQGLIGPAARVTLGLVFGVALLGTAEWLYRRVAGVAGGLAAAGIAVLYTSLLAGVRLYELIHPTAGFAGMALTTAVAVALALRHGQIVAILGLFGGFLTPILISTEEQHPWQLLFYLVLLQIALLYVSRRKAWWPIAGLTLLGVMGWALLWLADLATIGGDTLHIGLLLMVSIVSFVIAAGRSAQEETWGDARIPQALVWCGAGIGIILLSALVGVGDFGLQEWAFLGIVGAGCIILGRMDSSYEGLAWLASIAAAGMLLIWGAERDVSQLTSLWWIAFVFATMYVGGAYLAMWGSANPERWAALSSVSGIIYLLAAYFGFGDTEFAIPWGVQALVLAAILTGLATPVARRRESILRGNVTLAALAVGVTAIVSLAVPMELERAWITVAWAVEIPALAVIALRLRVPELEKLAWILSGLVAIRLLINPGVFDYPIGDGVLFNWLLYGYGVPIVAFVVGTLIFRRSGTGKFADLLEAGAMALGFVYLTLSVRQFFHPGDLAHSDFEFAELGAFTVVWLLYGLGLLALYRGTERRNHMLAGASAGLLALTQGLLYQGLFFNPLGHPHAVGTAIIFNKLLFVYGLPAILAALLARAFNRINLKIQSWIAGSMALVFCMLTLSLEVRQAYQGNVLNEGPTTNAEMYTYSLVWVLFAIALLVAGIATRGAVLRYGSAAVMALAVGKVFLVDTAQLEDLYRVFSLLGLGITLMVLAYLYQKYVFRE